MKKCSFLGFQIIFFFFLGYACKKTRPNKISTFEVQCLSFEGTYLYDAKKQLMEALGYPDTIINRSTVQVKDNIHPSQSSESESQWQLAGSTIKYEYYQYRRSQGILEFAICNDSAFIMNLIFANSTIEVHCNGIKLSKETEYSEAVSWPMGVESSMTTEEEVFKLISFPNQAPDAPLSSMNIFDVPTLYFQDGRLHSLKNFPGKLNRSNCMK